MVEQQIYEHALKLFADKGFASTSLQDIADSMGTSRPKLYYYVKTKDDLLNRLVEEITETGAQAAREIESSTEPAAERLRRLVHGMALRRAREPERFRLLDRCESELPAGLAAKHLAAKRMVVRGLSEVLADGITEGVFHPLDERVAAFTIIGMCNWVAWWYRPGGERDEGRIADQVTEMALAAVLAEPGTPSADRGPQGLIKLIRRDVDVLERLLDPRAESSGPDFA
ncbi:TetR/AcrR family transcriptional regulator [Actinomadura montaniterrae]|uniref:TetR/AcrR family transcriptional regulator n=1 Tax=Actinomadura montaniterrae TaxID=1803903 RepID=A0A6L3W2X5_9ACTN|nr:TetR/AcrR family transcriptional regulator [Actinomadura montaniterrae]